MIKENTLWVEKWRPKTIDECILTDDIKKAFKSFVANKDIPNMLLTGKPGIGKTTIAKAACSEMGVDCMVINASDENGIDTLRNKIKTFASSVSLSGGQKVVILDEADYLQQNSVQPALRNFLEEFSGNCRFILTCNYKRRIIEPLLSRLTVFEFAIPSTQKAKVAAGFMKRVQMILASEGIDYDNKVLAEVIMKFFPDFRKCLSELQRYHNTNGKIDVGILSYIQDASIKDLMKDIKEKNFGGMRKWVAENLDSDPNTVIRLLFDSLEDYLIPASIPQAILILADFQYKAAFVADQEINMTAMLTNIMAECTFR
jgi:DNA polymerase III delta prime subunit